MMPSPSQPEDVGPPSIRSSPLKRPLETSIMKQSVTKRAKPSAAGNKDKASTSSPLKRPIETGTKKQPAAKRFKPPMAENMPIGNPSPLVRRSPLVRTPQLRLVVSPVVMSQEVLHGTTSSPPAAERSPSLSSESLPLDEGTSLPGSSSAQSKPRKLKSQIWSDMDPIYQNGRIIRAQCKHCNEVFSAARNSGNSHMRRHLNKCEPRLKMHSMVEKLQSTDATVMTNLTNWKFDKAVTRCELVRLVVLHELPFSLVEYEGFRSYSLSLNPLAESVSRTTIKSNCVEAFVNQRRSIRDMLVGLNCRVSLTSDLWTAHKNTGYMVITCHYIDDDWTVQKRIIRFCVVKTPHDGFNLYSEMLKTIRYYNIEDKLFSITLDNASANKTMMDLLSGSLLKKSMLHCGGDLFHARCGAHVLNLIVKDGLQSIEGVISDIRESVKYIKGSQSRKEKFEEIIAELGIECKSRPSLDVPTRWNSTCDMLQSAFPFKDAFPELAKQDPNYMHSPTPEGWERAVAVCKLLIVFKKATEVVSGTRYPTSNLYFHEIWNVKQVLESDTSRRNPIIASMVSDMKAKFDKYWKISYLSNCIPVILDPRFKFKFVEFRLRQVFGGAAVAHIGKVDEVIRSLFNGYSSEIGDGNSNSAEVNDNASSVEGCSWSDWSSHVSAQRNQGTGELDRYLCDDLFPCTDKSFDILHWWKMHVTKYPILSRMARDVLAAPASTVAAESAFSTGGRIINDHRTRLSGNTVEALICFQDWLREAGASYLDIIKINSLISSDEVQELGDA